MTKPRNIETSQNESPVDSALLRSILNGHPNLTILSVDRSGRYLAFNQQHAAEMERIFGQQIEIGSSFLDALTRPETRAEAKADVDRAVSGESFTTLRVVPSHGLHYEMHWVPLRSSDGEIIGTTAYVADVTEREEISAAHKLQLERFEQTLETTQDGYILLSVPDGRILEANPAYCKMAGYSLEELLSMTVMDVDVAMNKEQIGNRIERLLKTRRDRFHTQHQTKHAGVIDLEVSIGLMDLEQGPVITAFMRDVTERTRVESELRKLSVAVEQSPATVVITDLDGNIEYVNAKFTQLTGYEPEEVIGKNPRILQSGKIPADVYRGMWGTLVAGNEWRGEFHNRKKNGDLFWEDASISPIHDPDGAITHFLAVKEDVTERKEMEEQLRQSQKMEAVGQLAGGVAHDFNNLLTVINGYSGLMLDGMSPDDDNYEMVSEIASAGDRAASLTRQLLSFSRKQVLQPRVLNLNWLIRGMEKMVRRLIDESVAIETRLDPELGRIEADPGQIEQIILNLSLNARDAMPHGGVLTIETLNVERPSPVRQPPEELASTTFVAIRVTDTGCGMPEEIRKRIFEPFFTTKGVEKGTGLGLFTVYGIIRRSGGDIRVESEEGKGTHFEILLPRIAENAGAMEADPASASVELNGSETILLVEDEEAVRKLTSATLKQFGYSVLTAEDGLDAQETVAAHEGKIDLLLTDVIMPNLSGKELAAVLRAKDPALRVVFMSGYTDQAFAHGVLEEGTHFIQKPFAPDSLGRIIRTALA